MRAPFPYFGGKSSVTDIIWARLGSPKQFIEPFCGSAAVLLAAPAPATLEVVNDLNGFIANFWRTVKHDPARVAKWADYPVSQVDLGARHRWLMAERARLADALQDPDWPGDPKVAGWWLWGQCAWIGSGWCEGAGNGRSSDQIPFLSSPGQGVTAAWAIGQVPHITDGGRGVQAMGKIPHITDGGQEEAPLFMTSTGRTSWVWLHVLAARLERVRVLHGEWHRCLNHHYGAEETAVFLDPPYKGFETVYGAEASAPRVEDWAREHADLRIALCGHIGDYDLPGWTCIRWRRPNLSYGSEKTTDAEAIYFSPACLSPTEPAQMSLFDTREVI
jgi:DNA adenine methylase